MTIIRMTATSESLHILFYAVNRVHIFFHQMFLAICIKRECK
uniref:Uncharacterized protein n=1 Tax=Setaria italica TaxID=4555 RepID=K3Z1Q0_SETIT